VCFIYAVLVLPTSQGLRDVDGKISRGLHCLGDLLNLSASLKNTR
jgi:hypothetical protein